MQREIRQRCGFGCVVCGLPLYEYEHLDGYAAMQVHEAARITLLCDKHHSEKTKGLLPLDSVEAANAAPYNGVHPESAPYDLHYSGDSCEVSIGGNVFTTRSTDSGSFYIPVSIDEIPLIAFSFQDAHLFITLNLFDQDNRQVLAIHQNRLVYRPDQWDIAFVGRRLTLRSGSRKILLDIAFETPNRIVIDRGRLLCNGVELLVRPDSLTVVNNAGTFCGSSVAATRGIAIGPHSQRLPTGIQMEAVDRYSRNPDISIHWLGANMPSEGAS